MASHYNGIINKLTCVASCYVCVTFLTFVKKLIDVRPHLEPRYLHTYMDIYYISVDISVDIYYISVDI